MKKIKLSEIESMSKTLCLVKLLKLGIDEDIVELWNKRNGQLFAQLTLAKELDKRKLLIKDI